MPLLRLDVGRLFSSLVGSSEARTRETILRAEAMSPCILWIDEIDKGFGVNASKFLLDHGFALSDNEYNLNIINSGMRFVRDDIDFVKIVRSLDEARKVIDVGLKSGELINVFMRHGSKLGIEMGEGQIGLFKYALGIDSDDSHDFSYSIYDAGNPYRYMNEIFNFMSNLSYANDIVNRF